MTGNQFSLKGYSLPLTPKGRASVVEPPPWHFGGNVMHLVFEADPDRVRPLIPPPLEMGTEPGMGGVWLVEWVSVSESNPDLAWVNPERSVYRECVIVINVTYKGKPGVTVPYIWVNNDFTLVRGVIQGFPKKLASVYLTKLHHLNPKVGGLKPGAKIRGICSAHGERLVEGTLEITRPAEVSEVPMAPMYLMRHFPSIEDPAKPAVHELVSSNVTWGSIDNVWAGKPDIKLFESEVEELADLGSIKAVKGFYYDMGMTIQGGKVIHRY